MKAAEMTLKTANNHSQKLAVPVRFCLTQTYTALRKGQNRMKRTTALSDIRKVEHTDDML